MMEYSVLVTVTDNEYSDTAKTVFGCEIVSARHGKHSVASAWELVERREVKLKLYFVDYWTKKSLSIHAVDFQQTSICLLSLNFVDVWLEKL